MARRGGGVRPGRSSGRTERSARPACVPESQRGVVLLGARRGGGRVGEQTELGVRCRGASSGSVAPAWWVWCEWWVVGDGEVAVQLGEGVVELIESVGVAGVEDDVDEVADAAAVLFAGDAQGGDRVVPLVVVERLPVDERCGEVSERVADFVEAEWVIHQKLHPFVG